jgi:hypothetical protein
MCELIWQPGEQGAFVTTVRERAWSRRSRRVCHASGRSNVMRSTEATHWSLCFGREARLDGETRAADDWI